jgi:NAD(P)-dependent dehydrogenase (short-subunit alcohol dehydrogenase family)
MKATVVLVCRNKDKGEAARREVAKKTGNDSVDLLLCDPSSLAEVRGLVAEVRNRYGKLHVFVNNAGIFSFSGKTVDGFETTLAVDYLAPFLLTNLLLELLKSSSPSRIVNVSSVAHFGGHIDLAAIERRETSAGWGAYSNSKLALVMFTYELARRLKGTGVTANCLHPGGGHQNMADPPCVGETIHEERQGRRGSFDLFGVCAGGRGGVRRVLREQVREEIV